MHGHMNVKNWDIQRTCLVDWHVSTSQRKTFTKGLNAESKHELLIAIQYIKLKLVDNTLRQKIE